MYKKLQFLIVISLSIFSSSVFSSTEECSVDDSNEIKITNIYFANGVLNSEVDTIISTWELQRRYRDLLESIETNEKYIFQPAYNNSQGVRADVVQVLQQKIDDIDGLNIGAYSLLQLLTTFPREVDLFRNLIKEIYGKNIPNESVAELFETTFNAEVTALRDSRDVESSFIERYEADLIAGKRVLIIAHSQGNLFTRNVVESIRERQPSFVASINYIGLASPDSRITEGAKYITAEDDRVINLLRELLGDDQVLPGNINNVPSSEDFRSILRHNFVNDYLDVRLASAELLKESLLELAVSTEFPEQIASSGAMRASLSWGDQPDVDLHIFEPDGTHVYYENQVGNDGTLDVDDVDGFGPENYFVDCSDLNEGTYQIGVNYFRGSEPEDAKVSLFFSDGRSISPRTIRLTESRGRVGDDEPINVFNVIVSKNNEGDIFFNIE